ncbi:MAG: hypothetical protein FJ291_08805 [Planctomycetes bacterium]|nr:hypothetical protein [Planctomycetota bacterium]
MARQRKHSDVRSRARAILFWGTWLAFVPAAALFLGALVILLLNPYLPGIEAKHVGMIVGGVVVVLASVPWVRKITRDYLAGRRAERDESD